MFSRLKRVLLSAWETFEVIFISVATVFVIRTFLVQPFLVSGASMEPTFSDGNYLLIDEITYRFREPERGEVVVFRYPGDPQTFFIKRIIGLPGERVRGEGGRLTVFPGGLEKGAPIEEQYLPQGARTPGLFDVTLKEDEYFVLGDNRSYSFDSRQWGPVKRKNIIGIVRLRLLPLSEFSLEKPPVYRGAEP